MRITSAYATVNVLKLNVRNRGAKRKLSVRKKENQKLNVLDMGYTLVNNKKLILAVFSIDQKTENKSPIFYSLPAEAGGLFLRSMHYNDLIQTNAPVTEGACLLYDCFGYNQLGSRFPLCIDSSISSYSFAPINFILAFLIRCELIKHLGIRWCNLSYGFCTICFFNLSVFTCV